MSSSQGGSQPSEIDGAQNKKPLRVASREKKIEEQPLEGLQQTSTASEPGRNETWRCKEDLVNLRTPKDLKFVSLPVSSAMSKRVFLPALPLLLEQLVLVLCHLRRTRMSPPIRNRAFLPALPLLLEQWVTILYHPFI